MGILLIEKSNCECARFSRHLRKSNVQKPPQLACFWSKIQAETFQSSSLSLNKSGRLK